MAQDSIIDELEILEENVRHVNTSSDYLEVGKGVSNCIDKMLSTYQQQKKDRRMIISSNIKDKEDVVKMLDMAIESTMKQKSQLLTSIAKHV